MAAAQPAAWSWPEDILNADNYNPAAPNDTRFPGAFEEDEAEPRPEPQPEAHNENTGPTPGQRHYPPRTCRICLEEVLPTYEPFTGAIPSMLNPTPKVKYTSPEGGRLISPCKCRGSQRYVHEGCLQAWRHADPSYGRRNYWECPTCKYKYSLERMKYRSWITSTLMQIVITFAIMLGAVFIFGFVADPIINLYLDPYETITSIPSGGAQLLLEDEDSSWAEHFLKGLASLGLLGFVKVFFAMSPWHWWNLRHSGILGGGRRRAGTGQDRLQDISWTVVIIGVVTFLAVGLG